MIYVDFDGVIFESESLLFEGYRKLKVKSESIKLKYIQNIDWNNILDNSEIINDAIEILKRTREDVAILTKIHSMENEGTAKIRKLRNVKYIELKVCNENKKAISLYQKNKFKNTKSIMTVEL